VIVIVIVIVNGPTTFYFGWEIGACFLTTRKFKSKKNKHLKIICSASRNQKFSQKFFGQDPYHIKVAGYSSEHLNSQGTSPLQVSVHVESART